MALNDSTLRLIYIAVMVALLAHMLIISSCVWWWEVYKFNVDWKRHVEIPVPSMLYILSAPSWFWVDLVITVIVFSSFSMIIVFVRVLAKSLGLSGKGFILATVLYHALLLANWIWYEIFRANMSAKEKLNPDSIAYRFLVWGDALYIVTSIAAFLAIAVFISRAALPRIESVLTTGKRCLHSILWISITVETYILILIASFIWFNILIYTAGERLTGWAFPSPFYLWRASIYLWATLAYMVTLTVFAVVIGGVSYREIKARRG
jgi:hypothetical protein